MLTVKRSTVSFWTVFARASGSEMSKRMGRLSIRDWVPTVTVVASSTPETTERVRVCLRKKSCVGVNWLE